MIEYESDKAAKAILIVDDDELNRDVLANIFEAEHEILGAADVAAALEELKANKKSICAIFLDVYMPMSEDDPHSPPGPNGISMLKELALAKVPDNIPVFLITGAKDGGVIKDAYDFGVMDVISKPFSGPIVKKRVNSALELFAVRNEAPRFMEHLRARNQRLGDAVKSQSDMIMALIEALATATEFRSEESGAHVRRLRRITELFLHNTSKPEYEKKKSGDHNEYSEEDIKNIGMASVLHDIGKICVRDDILTKPGKLDPKEREEMEKHAEKGYEMLSRIPEIKNHPFYTYALDIAWCHHERWDGKGYPRKLAGEEIPFCAQIVAIADVYDALASKRVYKPPFSHQQAVQMILDGKCGAFNPDLLEVLKKIEPEIEQIYKHSDEELESGK